MRGERAVVRGADEARRREQVPREEALVRGDAERKMKNDDERAPGRREHQPRVARRRGFTRASRASSRASAMTSRGVASREDGLLEPRLHDVALDAKEVGRPRPGLDRRELIVGDAVVRVARVVAALARARDARGA